MSRVLQYEGDLEIFAAGNGPNGPSVGFVIDFDYTPGHPGCWYLRNGDPGFPPEPAEVIVNSVKVFRGSDEIDAPEWLKQLILECVDDETLMEYAAREYA